MKDTHGPSHVVGIGASAGGLEALKAFTSVLADGFRGAVVVAQHLSPTHRSLLAPLIQRTCRLPIIEVKEEALLEPGKIYVIPENADVEVSSDTIRLLKTEGRRGPHPTVDRLFASIAETWGKNGVGVVLSGTGQDGSLGAAAIDDAGGILFAQDEDSAKYWSMPKALIDRSLAKAVLPPEMLANSVVQYIETGELPGSEDAENSEDGLNVIAALAEEKLDFGIMSYKRGTVMRRLGARLAATQCKSIDDYNRVLAADSREIQRLASALLIPVTSFFRDPTAFDDLALEVRKLIEQAGEEGRVFRTWTAGCCTGEEAYSLAMLIDGIASESPQQIEYQIFATDLSEPFIDAARRGRFTEDAIVDLDSELLDRYFEQVPDGYQVVDRLRERIVFAKHDIMRSTPFMHIDLASCRNLLIYLNPEAQASAFSTLATAIRPGGLLFLGRTESTVELAGAFSEVSARSRIFRRKGDSLGADVRRIDNRPYRVGAGGLSRRRVLPAAVDRAEAMRLHLLEAADPTFLIDSDDAVLQFAGNGQGVISLATGPAPKDVYALVNSDLRVDLRSTILACRRTGERAISRLLRTSDGDGSGGWRITATPMTGAGADDDGKLLFVSIKRVEVGPAPANANGAYDDAVGELTAATSDLETELQETRLNLKTVIEELEVANEELQVANEELMASNEEFQVTNEELEASNEELQATNEELETINDELNMRYTEISNLNIEIKGIQDNLSFPLFIFDSDMQVKSINAAGQRLTERVAPGMRLLNFGNVAELLGLKPAQGQFWETRDGRTKTKRIVVKKAGRQFEAVRSQFRNANDELVANALFLIDITAAVRARKRTEDQKRALEELEAQHRATLDGVAAQTALLDPNAKIIAVNKGWVDFAKQNGMSSAKMGVGANYLSICHSANGADADEAMSVAGLISDVLAGRMEEGSVDYPCHGPDEERWFKCLVRSVRHDGKRAAVVMHINRTSEVLFNRELEIARAQAQQLSDAKSKFLASMSHELRTPLTAIIGFSDLMQNEGPIKLGERRFIEYCKDINESGRHLLAIISDILEFSRIEQTLDEVKEADFSLRSCAEFAIDIVSAAFKQKQIDFDLRFERGLPRMHGAERLMRQALINVLTNAAKAVDPESGSVLVSCRRARDGSVLLECADNGPGVKDIQLGQLFEPFEQGEFEHVDAFDRGIGLGLAIVKSAVSRHDGDIEAINRNPSGLRIQMRFPKERFPKTKAQHA